jgi:hypothetical protein
VIVPFFTDLSAVQLVTQFVVSDQLRSYLRGRDEKGTLIDVIVDGVVPVTKTGSTTCDRDAFISRVLDQGIGHVGHPSCFL